MIIIVFLLGRPGSGKSSVASLIEMFAGDRGWLTYYKNDYEYLQQMFLREEAECIPIERRNFRHTGPVESNGFDVIKFAVLGEVLEEMRKEVEEFKCNCSQEKNTLYLVEFARANYHDALELFGSELLMGARILYLDVDIDCCIERNHRRTDHFVSDEIMRTYYRSDDWPREMYHLQYSNDKYEIRNTGTLEEMKHKVEEWVDNQIERIDGQIESKVVVAESYATVA